MEIIFKIIDRSTTIGKTIDSYLQGKSNIDDHAIHLLFSANRWEMKYVSLIIVCKDCYYSYSTCLLDLITCSIRDSQSYTFM